MERQNKKQVSERADVASTQKLSMERQNRKQVSECLDVRRDQKRLNERQNKKQDSERSDVTSAQKRSMERQKKKQVSECLDARSDGNFQPGDGAVLLVACEPVLHRSMTSGSSRSRQRR